VKALPLWQPYASLVATGQKRIETRAFSPARFGLRPGDRFAIYATKGTGPGGKAAYWNRLADFRHLLVRAHDVSTKLSVYEQVVALDEALPRGQLIATCTLALASRMTAHWVERVILNNPVEHALGLYAPDRWAWMLTRVSRFPSPVDPPDGGSRQGAFEVPVTSLPCV
jgi:hypothetical protein